VQLKIFTIYGKKRAREEQKIKPKKGERHLIALAYQLRSFGRNPKERGVKERGGL